VTAHGKEDRMKRQLKFWTIVLAITCIWCVAMASPVTVGIKSKGNPGHLANCLAYTAGAVDLGTGTFNELLTPEVIADLRDPESATTVLVLDVNNVPANLCTQDGVATTAAAAACTSSYSMFGMVPIMGAESDILGFRWFCAKINNPAEVFWAEAACP
jgi:hypothetical protein